MYANSSPQYHPNLPQHTSVTFGSFQSSLHLAVWSSLCFMLQNCGRGTGLGAWLHSFASCLKIELLAVLIAMLRPGWG